ncbi:sigma-70 family RNA polymerase sigma factor [Roseivirga sp. E12]|uniref:sigma-70 family RNA polymerase sigma factor n=1 Tax=Roseivirga sp. E12 TaxID=2819237 RepID=UPI001ABC82E8|nr:sigma-70 family RNA polymerase sigma factor [Roseivirga sp. E12]MBO3697422.1 sigma-70 family RNA polymerase sigma factor [Roseivirga sp. E12]
MNPSCQVVAPVFQEYRTILTRFIQSRVNDPLESEELLSLVMMKIYDNCEKVEGVRNIEAWLITIARNTITDYFREQQKITKKELDINIVDEPSQALYEELESCVPSLIQKLPEKYARPLADYELKGIPQKELAIVYGLSESGLKSRVQRGRIMLKALFTEYCGHLVVEQGCSDCSDC